MQRVSALWQASPRKLVGALFVLMLAAMMAVASGASFTSTSANVGNIVTAGTLTHDNVASGPNNTILTVDNLMPGDDAQGTVTLTNTGDGDGILTLDKSNLVNTPATPAFSAKLDLVVQDVTNPGSPVIKYDGKLGAMGQITNLGPIAPGASKTYQFIVEFPDGGVPASATTGDNRYKNASTTVDYNWEMVSQ
jgi:spore coat-associated protein N